MNKETENKTVDLVNDILIYAMSKEISNINYIINNFEKIEKQYFSQINKKYKNNPGYISDLNKTRENIKKLPFIFWKNILQENKNIEITNVQTAQFIEPNPLQLVLQRVYFNQILKGTKKIEYREKKKFYNARLMKAGEYRNFKHVIFREGYRKDARRMTVEITKIELSGSWYEIHLRNIINRNF